MTSQSAANPSEAMQNEERRMLNNITAIQRATGRGASAFCRHLGATRVHARATLLAAAVFALVAAGPAPATADQDDPPSATRPVEQTQPARKTQAELDAWFSALLTDATLEGTWQATPAGQPMDAAPLSPPFKDRYTILAANKADGEWWQLRARIQYTEHDVVLPIRVRVVWAEQTPVITIDEMNFPGLGVYSARVLFHGPFYSGVWTGGGHGGVLSGRVSRANAPPAQDTDAGRDEESGESAKPSDDE